MLTLPESVESDPYAGEPLSFFAGRARVLAAIGSPEAAAEANAAAPKGAQLGLL